VGSIHSTASPTAVLHAGDLLGGARSNFFHPRAPGAPAGCGRAPRRRQLPVLLGARLGLGPLGPPRPIGRGRPLHHLRLVARRLGRLLAGARRRRPTLTRRCSLRGSGPAGGARSSSCRSPIAGARGSLGGGLTPWPRPEVLEREPAGVSALFNPRYVLRASSARPVAAREDRAIFPFFDGHLHERPESTSCESHSEIPSCGALVPTAPSRRSSGRSRWRSAQAGRCRRRVRLRTAPAPSARG